MKVEGMRSGIFPYNLLNKPWALLLGKGMRGSDFLSATDYFGWFVF